MNQVLFLTHLLSLIFIDMVYIQIKVWILFCSLFEESNMLKNQILSYLNCCMYTLFLIIVIIYHSFSTFSSNLTYQFFLLFKFHFTTFFNHLISFHLQILFHFSSLFEIRIICIHGTILLYYLFYRNLLFFSLLLLLLNWR